MHLNTQAMTSTFKEFLLTIKTCTLDVALLSETWLRDQKELLDYVSIDRYATEFRHRVATKSGGVGTYIKKKKTLPIDGALTSKKLSRTWSTYGWSSKGKTNTVNC